MSNKSGQGPLLYIVQPFSNTPSNYQMQEVYTNKRELEETLAERGREDKTNRQQKKKGHHKEPIPIDIPPDELEQSKAEAITSDTTRPSFKRVKPFKQMNLTERLEYLLHFPKALPPVPCVFYTENENYQGYLNTYENEQVTIQFPDQTTKTIPVSQLTNVMMIGIKR
ncbi:hypothetical protein HPT25_13845 [Bacillus sp. BRMEA1]|uniref:CotO family spore coat protein n=1 Tax=Neobacillus endophyticus TaxID=2738405 RepID=UPI001567BBBD|nr:CotO family spore coat protein [Neobacillus endophyticus]NRD78451.1 hypothetical protein [Neobacillus endophyticus]